MAISVTAWGRLTENVEKRLNPKGIGYAIFSIATPRARREKNGELLSDFLRCIVREQEADYLSIYTRKGDTIYLSGELVINTYETEAGEKRVSPQLEVSKAQIIKRAKNPINESNNVGEIPF